MLKDKRILVTGGTGSFGNHIIRRLVNSGAKEIRIFSRDEKKQFDMKHEYSNITNLNFMIGDVKDKKRVSEAMKGIDIVYHAAALKQVPSCENYPFEAIKTNILGAKNVVDAALEEGVEKVVAISTDKAVKPVNSMGMTKALQEKVMISANFSTANKKTKISCVRYGNVMGSRGSVIPFFRKLLEKNKTLTITHQDMTRFMLTLSDAVDLVLYATENMKGGEIFVKKAPSTKIIDLARMLSEESKKKFEYKIIGMFPGEKIHEILISEEEILRAEDKGGFFIIHHTKPDNVNGPTKEYSSKDEIVSDEQIKQLIKSSDEEEEKYKESIFFNG